MKSTLFHLHILIVLSSCTAQTALSYTEFLQVVKENHPVARQAALLQEQSKAEILLARGEFDTKAYSDWDKKSFDGKTYFLDGHSGFKTPTWYGLSWKTEYLTNSGVFTNPESSLPSVGQMVAGVELSALQGLLIDERRTALKQARQLVEINANERERILNNLLLHASESYWNWVGAYRQLEVLRSARTLADQRFQGIVQSFTAGDQPAIDTLESWIQVRTRDAEIIEASQYLFETAQKMSVFVWTNDQQPLEADNSLAPETVQLLQQDIPISQTQILIEKHPEVLKFDLKQRSLEIDRRMKREKLKPKLQLEYNFLGNGFDIGPPPGTEGINGLLLQNYKWAISFSQPLFLRKERAEIKLNSLKLQENELERQLKLQDLNTKRRSALARVSAARAEVVVLVGIAADYLTLLDAEQTKFLIGESSIFLLNSRDNKRIEAELKLAKARAEMKKAEAMLRWTLATWP